MIADGCVITPDLEAEWLEARRNTLGASEVGSALGVAAAPWPTPVELWQRKTGRAAATVSTLRMRIGKALEPLIAEEYEAETGRRIVAQQVFRRPEEYPWLSATLDGLTECGRVVEFKRSSFGRFGDEDAIPDHYYLQVQQQLLCHGADVADLAILCGDDRLVIHTIPRDERLVASVVAGSARFWRCVQDDTPPDWGRVTAADLAAVNPLCEGEVSLIPDVARQVGCYEEIGEAIKGMEKVREDYKLGILAAMGNARLGRLPDGRAVKRFLEQVEESERHVKVKAHTRHYFKVLKGNG